MKYIKIEIEGQIRLIEKAGKPKRKYEHEVNNEEIRQKLEEYCYPRLLEISRQHIKSKKERQQQFEAIKEDFLNQYSDEERRDLPNG